MSEQVPLWIPILVAVIGAAGVLLGQTLAARRERSSAAAREKYDQARKIRDKRLEVYLAYMVALDSWQQTVTDWIYCLYMRDDEATAREKTLSLQDEMRELSAQSHVVGSEPVRTEFYVLDTIHSVITSMLAILGLDQMDATNQAKIDYLKNAKDQVSQARKRTIDLMREDLEL